MQNELMDRPTVQLTIDRRCRSCVMPRLLLQDLQSWDLLPENGRVDWAIEEHVERRCGACLDSVVVTEEASRWHFRVEIAAAD
jgi:hypothetical protein